MGIDLSLLGMLVLVAVTAVATGLWLDASLSRGHRRMRPALESSADTVFIFDGDVLVDATPTARQILALNSGTSGAWQRLVNWLAERFPEVEDRLRDLPQRGQVHLASSRDSDRALLLNGEYLGGLVRLTLVDVDSDESMALHDPLTQRVTAEELDLLRGVAAGMPVLAWKERPDGIITWANAPYMLKVAEKLPPGEDLTWPLPRLFPQMGAQEPEQVRQSLTLSNGTVAWFDLTGAAVPGGTDRLVFARAVNDVVNAERALRDVLLTLTKTFAHLHVALMIFDRSRQLQLFNPALIDLTGLPVDFLAKKPTLTAVLDALRERNMIPEPKDYRSWRRQLIEMERAAASGHYEETWSLPSGQTYRVIGRPHPDGALALIMEDISDEMTRSRRYRAEIELGLSVIDGLDEAVAVFSQTGQLVMSNAAHDRLWRHDPTDSLSEASLASIVAEWREGSAPNPAWARLEDFAMGGENRQPWTVEVRLLDGRSLSCRVSPLVGGATMVMFRQVQVLPGPAMLAPASQMKRA